MTRKQYKQCLTGAKMTSIQSIQNRACYNEPYRMQCRKCSICYTLCKLDFGKTANGTEILLLVFTDKNGAGKRINPKLGNLKHNYVRDLYYVESITSICYLYTI